MSYLGWFANILIVIGIWKIGDKWRHAFLFSIAGETLWTIKAGWQGQYDLAVICFVFCVLAFRNWLAWGRGSSESREGSN